MNAVEDLTVPQEIGRELGAVFLFPLLRKVTFVTSSDSIITAGFFKFLSLISVLCHGYIYIITVTVY